ncbi:MAG: hypothetical protein LCH56_16210 [Proteobacteria bacterium]|nr:hypothetical protein [Pseudomonadota bacterium]
MTVISGAKTAAGKPYRRSPLMAAKLNPDGAGEYTYIRLDPIDEELLYFLNQAIPGVSAILDVVEMFLTERTPGGD